MASDAWISIAGDILTYQICEYTLNELVQYRLRAKNNAGYSDVATSNTVRTHCTGK